MASEGGDAVGNRPAVTVVIPVLNGGWCIAEQLGALAAQDIDQPFEVLVCDNGSTDNTAEVVRAWVDRLPGLRLLDAVGRRGASHARNIGIREATAPVISFCDADDVVSPQWLRIMLESVRPGLMINGWIDLRALNPVGTYQGDGMQRDLIMRCGYRPGIESGNFALTTEDARRLKGFDESFMFAEDIDIAWRGQQQGLELAIVPAIVHYRLRADARLTFRQHRNWAYWSIMLRCRHQRHIPPSFSFKYSIAEFCRQTLTFPWHWLREGDSGRREAARKYGTACGELAGHLRFRVFGSPPDANFSVFETA